MDGYYIPEFMTEINNLSPDPKPTENPGFDKFRIDVYYHQINNLALLNDKDRYNFIKSNVDLISTHVVDGTCKYMKRLVEPVFLNTFMEVLKNMPITQLRRMAVNKLCYSYQFAKIATPDIQNKLLQISRIVNRPYIDLLRGINLPDEDAMYLCMCRFSSSDEMVNVNRLNYAIYTRGTKMMTEQQIVWIFEKLYDQTRYLFAATMMETKDTMLPPDGCDEDEFYETFSTLSLALLTIVNNMTIEDIDRLIRIFIDRWIALGRPETRFSLRALSGDFGRLRSVVENLSDRYHVYVP